MSDPFAGDGLEILLEERALAKRNKARAELRARKEIVEKSSEVLPEESPEIQLLKRHGQLEKILSYITDPADITAAYNSCGAFRKILEPKMALIIQEKALHVVFDNQFGNQEDGADLLRLRLLNKSMMTTVDKYFYKHPYRHWYFPRTCSSLSFDLTEIYQVNRAITVLSGSGALGKQLLSRNLRIYYPYDDGNSTEFAAAVKFLLELFGGLFQSVIYEPPSTDDIGETYQRICDWAKLMPALQNLQILENIHRSDDDTDDSKVQDLTRRINLFPFPHLPMLRYCEVYYKNRAYRKILGAVFKANPGIKQTSLKQKDLVALPTAFRPEDVQISFTDIPPVLIPAIWPLKKLDITLCMDEDPWSTSVLILFPVLEKFKETLTILTVSGVKLHEDDGLMTYLDLPKVKTLQIELNEEFHKLDFMLPMQSLETLVVTRFYETLESETFGPFLFRLDETEKIQFKGFIHRMEDSNIGRVFPFLNQLNLIGFLEPYDWSEIEYKRNMELNLLKLDDEMDWIHGNWSDLFGVSLA